ncbi:MAG TPA: hypothetical protein VD948_07975, partial [Rhodothermales bacterium]|nr:hypothetical protein [Rhodothermales bacterium]
MLHRLRDRLRRLHFGLLLAAALTGCRDRAPETPTPGTFTWRAVESPALGVSLRAPSTYAVVEESDNLFFRFNGTPARVVLVTPEEADRRGLWARSEPREAVRIA